MELEEKLKKYQEKIKQKPLTSAIITIALLLLLLLLVPYLQVNIYEISNDTAKGTLENQYRATIAQILGGVAIGIGLYYTWRRISISEKELKATQKNLAITQKNLRVAQDNLKVAQEGQITERFTRAVDQLGAVDQFGNPVIEIRIGGIYALERIANESEKDYWPIMEILTAYVRKNSSVGVLATRKITYISMDIQANESTKSKISEVEGISLDVQAILTVIGRRKSYFNNGEAHRLNLRATCLKAADLIEAHLEGANFTEANLEEANLWRAKLEGAKLWRANLEGAKLWEVNLKEAELVESHLERAKLSNAFLKEAYLHGVNLQEAALFRVNLQGANLFEAHLEDADLRYANLEGARLEWDNLERANLEWANFEKAKLRKVNFKGANLKEINFEGADIQEANFMEASLEGANLRKAHLGYTQNLTIDQLSKVKTLYKAQLDPELEKELRAKGFGYLLDDEPKEEP